MLTPLSVVVLALFVCAFSLAAPFLPGAQNMIGILIIGIAMWEAWKFTKARALPIHGPYQLGPNPQQSGQPSVAISAADTGISPGVA
ncbi:MAG TPA: hypothetical protein VHX65_05415 [Pirellulales bacterium]|nr:hypothetical protein [Pirellulales bacterium]